MAEELEEKELCGGCGADVRPNALFCYNCGSQVASDEEVAAETQNGSNVSSAWFKETISDTKITENKTVNKNKTLTATKTKEIDPIPKPSESLPKPNLTNTEKSPTEGLKTAASIRKRPNPFLKKKVEVVWEKPESAPNIWFLIVSVLLAGFAIFILFAMLYIK